MSPEAAEKYYAARWKARRDNLCYKCAAPWFPGHTCEEGAIIEAARDRLRQGHSQINVTKDLLLGLEGEASDIRQPSANATNLQDRHFASENLDELDEALAGAQIVEMDGLADAIEQDIVTNAISAEAAGHQDEVDFQ